MLVQSILILSSIATAFAAATSPEIAQKVASLRTAPTQLDRLNILSDDADWKFSYLEQTSDANKYTDSPGSVVNGNAATWPAVIGNGMTMALLTLGPCAMLPAHYHPRAANYVMAFNGSVCLLPKVVRIRPDEFIDDNLHDHRERRSHGY